MSDMVSYGFFIGLVRTAHGPDMRRALQKSQGLGTNVHHSHTSSCFKSQGSVNFEQMEKVPLPCSLVSGLSVFSLSDVPYHPKPFQPGPAGGHPFLSLA